MTALLDSITSTIPAVQLAIVIAAVFLAGFVRGFVGFGAAMIVIMALSAVLGPLVAVPVASLAGIVTTLQLLPDAVRLSDRSFAVPFGLASFVGAPLGTLVLVSLDPALMKMGISIFVLFMVLAMWRGWQFGNGTSRGSVLSTGFAAGVIQGSAGVGGPPAVAVALARGGTAQQQRANVIGGVTSLAFCNMIPMWYHGLFTREVIIVSAVIVVPYIVSTWLGARFFSQQGQHLFRAAALWVLAVLGTVTLVLAIQDYAAL